MNGRPACKASILVFINVRPACKTSVLVCINVRPASKMSILVCRIRRHEFTASDFSHKISHPIFTASDFSHKSLSSFFPSLKRWNPLSANHPLFHHPSSTFLHTHLTSSFITKHMPRLTATSSLLYTYLHGVICISFPLAQA